MRVNLPNRITLLRLLAALALFLVLVMLAHRSAPHAAHWYLIAAGLFSAGAMTDFLDGYLARRLQLVTRFGRLADPFVDKVLVCGAFILLIPLTDLVPAWFTLVIIVRELGITALRSHLEGSGTPFGAGVWGKAKMLSQCIAVPAVLVYEAFRTWLPPAWWSVAAGIMGVTLLLTVASGMLYLRAAPLDLD